MTTFDLKKPPKGWTFPFSRKELRAFIESTDAHFSKVAFNGTNRASDFIPDRLSCWMGILESERTDAEWSFSLKIYCLQEQHVIPWKREITEGVARQMRNWILKKLSLPLTAPEKQMKLFLKYYIEDGKCCPACWEVD